MSRHSVIRPILLFGLMTSIVNAQTPSAPPGRAYKVAFWYDLAQPWSTAQYRAYDVAKGEYNKEAVDRWQKTIFEKYPKMGCCVRDLSTVGEPGATEAERLASAVEREKRRWAALNNGPFLPLPSLIRPSPTIVIRDKNLSRASFDRPSPGSPGTPMYPSPSPFPYPYRSGPR
jgi:hypothetical protein